MKGIFFRALAEAAGGRVHLRLQRLEDCHVTFESSPEHPRMAGVRKAAEAGELQRELFRAADG